MPREFPKELRKEFAAFKAWNTFAKVQDKIDELNFDVELGGEELRPPLEVLKEKKAQCLEGAMLAAAAFWYHGGRPLLLDLRTSRKYPEEFDHVVAPFEYRGFWGAVSKTNHGVLRYREPVYRDIRELAMSYFHEYFLDGGEKTLRKYSEPFDLSNFDPSWLTGAKDLDNIAEALDDSPHHDIFPPGMEKKLRLAHPTERAAGKVVEWKKK